MPALILLNGPPGSGKSTLATWLVERRPLALSLDIDVIRAQLGGWLERPEDSGRAARALAIAMTRTHLASGHDVVVPQFLARSELIEQLEQVALSADAPFVEIVLNLARSEAIDALEQRRRAPEHQLHTELAKLVERSELDDPVGQMWDGLQQLVRSRPNTRLVDAPRGQIAATLEAIVQELARCGIDW